MLRKKVQSLVTKENLGQQSNFEVIYDSKAAKITGGLALCGELQTCDNFNGTCDKLATCGTFSERPPVQP